MYSVVAGQVAYAASITVVKPAATQGWTTDTDAGGTVSSIEDASAPLGTGVLQLTTANVNQSRAKVSYMPVNLRLDAIAALSFDSKRISANDMVNGNATMRVGIDTNGENNTPVTVLAVLNTPVNNAAVFATNYDAADAAITTDETTQPVSVLGVNKEKDAENKPTAVSSTKTEDHKKWSLVNVLLTGAVAVMSLVTLAGVRESQGRTRTLKLATIAPAVVAVVAVLLVEDFKAPLCWFNVWTIFFVIVVAVQAALLANAKEEASE